MIRAFRPTQPDLIARRVGDVKVNLYAATGYLRRLGDLSNPEVLKGAEFIGFDRSDRLVTWLNELGIKVSSCNYSVITDNHLVHWELLKQGVGIGVMPVAVAEAEPGVRAAFPGLTPVPVENWLVAHRELKTSRRVRVVFDFLVGELT